jgi:hypothetical protein
MTERRGLSIKALIVGVLVDLGGDIVGVIMLGVVVSVAGGSFNEPTKHMSLLVPSLALATLSTFLAGWVAARVATRKHALHGLLVGVLAVCLGRLISHGKWTWIDIGSAVVSPLAAMAGGLVAAPRVRSTENEPAA